MDETRINTPCPSCGNTSLFIGKGGYLTCSVLECRQPSVEDAISYLKRRNRFLELQLNPLTAREEWPTGSAVVTPRYPRTRYAAGVDGTQSVSFRGDFEPGDYEETLKEKARTNLSEDIYNVVRKHYERMVEEKRKEMEAEEKKESVPVYVPEWLEAYVNEGRWPSGRRMNDIIAEVYILFKRLEHAGLVRRKEEGDA